MKNQKLFIKNTNLDTQAIIIKTLTDLGYDVQGITNTKEENKVVFVLMYKDDNYETFSNWVYPYDITIEIQNDTLSIINRDNDIVFTQLYLYLTNTFNKIFQR